MDVAFSYSIKDSGKGVNVKDLENDLTGAKTFENFLITLKKFHLKTSRSVLKEEQVKGFDKYPRVIVDNRKDVPIINVKDFGKIEFFARAVVSESILQIFDEIEKRSPVDTGQYRASNVVFFNKKLVAKNKAELRTFLETHQKTVGFKLKDTIRFINTTPYARRLEYMGGRRSLTGDFKGSNRVFGGRKIKSKKTGRILKRPNGAYYLAFVLAKNKFSGISRFIKFVFLPNGADGINIDPLPGEKPLVFKKGKGAGRPYLFPSIIIRLSDRGIIEKGVEYE